jgi:glycosyltransferase involved in cell wall biosynthesis
MNVCFEGFLSDAGVAAAYESADVFVSASRHEGFCLPLLEALNREVPVIARVAGGMPEALDGSGVLFETSDPRELAVLIDRVTRDARLRGEVLESQRKRRESLRQRDVAADCLRLLD